MPAIECALVAVFAQGNYGMVLPLIDVVRVTGAWCIAQ